jgi:hypothetical protein
VLLRGLPGDNGILWVCGGPRPAMPLCLGQVEHRLWLSTGRVVYRTAAKLQLSGRLEVPPRSNKFLSCSIYFSEYNIETIRLLETLGVE